MSGAGAPDRRRRDELRRARIEREHAAAMAAARRRRLGWLAMAVGAAVVVLAVVVASGSAGRGTSSSGRVAGVRASAQMLAGVPQHGITLGDPRAPVRVVEFADLQCPFCRAFALDELPRLVRDDVRPGNVRFEFRALSFIGPDSERAARVVEAARLQNRLWDVAELLYANQGRENSGYATDAFLRRVAGAVPGLKVARVLRDRDSRGVTAQLQAAATTAARARIAETPTCLVGRGMRLHAVDAAQLPAAIDAALGR